MSLDDDGPTYEVRQVLGASAIATTDDGEPAPEAAVSCLRYDHTGDWLAVGTKGGAIHTYQKGKAGYAKAATVTAFQTQVDPLNSLEIDSKVKDICWLKRCSSAGLLLAANDKFIRMYRVAERRGYVMPGSDCNGFLGLTMAATGQLELPRFVPTDSTWECKAKRLFASEHEYAINALSLSSDGEYFLSSDDLIVHLWHTSHTTESLKLLSVKPENMDDLNETITTALFHPEHCHLFSFSTSKGATHLCDLRDNATCGRYAAVFDAGICPAPSYVDPFYAALLNGVSHVAYNPTNSRQFVTRDFLTLKLWDMTMASAPVRVYPVQDHLLQSALPDLYETDVIFDRFEAAWAPDARYIATGMYRHEWVTIDVASGKANHHYRPGGPFASLSPPSVYSGADFGRKSLAVQCHPSRPDLAIANGGEVLLYTT
eukprot:TRINITY_DN16191_c0_g1_i1.p1 TRINITY_DN16191_c0_g1~~TRINITY_DN16191_c0_g1_i1.p1  ORF type:complete len:429 (-),score=67.35 TRINITY_DN16191_c0_g1_i1:107-1393(-)